jgi:steroid delta-isomerase-like uncharacterized protein
VSEQNKALAKRFYDSWTSGDLDAFDGLIAPNYQDHDTQNPNAGTPGAAGVKLTAAMYREAFPDTHFEIEAQISEGDYVVTRWTATGTQEGELMGMPATGKHVTVTGITIDRFEDGKIVEAWRSMDMLNVLRGIGALERP